MVARALSSSQAPAPWDRSRDYDDETDDDERVNPWDLDVDEAPVAPPFNDARVPSWVTLTRARWDKVTTSMASCATVPFLFLTMPQIVKNTGLIAAGRPDALAAISWQGQLAGLLGNMLLLSYFADKGELSASFVQIVGTCATGALLTQMCLAGHIPIAPFAVAAAAVSAGLILSGFRMLGRIGPVDTDGVPCVGNVQCAVSFDEDDEEELSIHGWWMRASNGLWDFYTHATGIVGLAALPQIGLMSLMPATLAAQCGVYPGAAGAALGTLLIILNYRGKLPPAVASAWGALSGWTATLLFMSMPVAQLASNFANPQTLEGLSILSALLAMTGNALMVPTGAVHQGRHLADGEHVGVHVDGLGRDVIAVFRAQGGWRSLHRPRRVHRAHRVVLRVPRRRVAHRRDQRVGQREQRGVAAEGVEDEDVQG